MSIYQYIDSYNTIGIRFWFRV